MKMVCPIKLKPFLESYVPMKASSGYHSWVATCVMLIPSLQRHTVRPTHATSIIDLYNSIRS